MSTVGLLVLIWIQNHSVALLNVQILLLMSRSGAFKSPSIYLLCFSNMDGASDVKTSVNARNLLGRAIIENRTALLLFFFNKKNKKGEVGAIEN